MSETVSATVALVSTVRDEEKRTEVRFKGSLNLWWVGRPMETLESKYLPTYVTGHEKSDPP